MSLPPFPGGSRTLPNRTRGDSMMDATQDTKRKVQTQLKTLTDSITSNTLEVIFKNWTPVDFLDDQCLSCDGRQIGKGLVYCGDEERAFVTTVSDYVAKQWPSCGNNVLGGIQRVCITKQSASNKILGCDVAIGIVNDDTRLKITGDRTTALMIIEVCIFVCMACQISLDKKKPSYATPLVQGPGTASGHVRVSATHNSLKQTSAANGLCWLAMVNNPVLAYRYPIPGRPSNTLLGLEIAFNVMVLLSSVEYAHSIADRFVLKSHFSALALTSVTGDCWAWHLSYSPPYVSLEEAFSVASHSSVQSNYDFPALSDGSHRHIVGWTPLASVVAGSGPPDMYAVRRSEAGSSKSTELRLDEALVGFTWKLGSLVSMSTNVLLNAYERDVSATILDSPGTFADIRMRAADTRVLFYGVDDARAWLLDGRSALLYMTKASMLERKLQDAMDDDATRLKAKNMLLQGGVYAIQTLKNARLMDTVLSTESGSKITVKGLVVDHWRRLEAMRAAFHAAKFGHKLSISATPEIGVQLVGFEFRPLVTLGSNPLSPGQTTLHNRDAKDWRDMMYDKDMPSIVIIGSSFGEMIKTEAKTDDLLSDLLPRVNNCPRTRPMQTGKDHLAIPHDVLLTMSEDFKQTGRNTVRIQPTRYIQIPTTVLNKCTCVSGIRSCACLAKLVTKADATEADGAAVKAMLDLWPGGALVIGKD